MSSLTLLKTGSLNQLFLYLPELENYSQLVIITHPKIKNLYFPSILSSLASFKCPIIEILVPEGESFKNLEQAASCWQQMIAHQVDRQAAILALGGGVIGDMAGFVGSCYMRGIDVYYLPTTLLAMVDASIGGKTGVNFSTYKNMIGTFYFPKKILIDPSVLSTLPAREFNSGIAEIIKYGIIEDFLLFEKLEQEMESLKNLKDSFLEEVIYRCMTLKNTIVQEDERDLTDRRAILNYGHTFGHAIETLTGYNTYLHGEAVSIGMSCAASLSVALGFCSSHLLERQDLLCKRADLPITFSKLPLDLLIKTMRNDKKASNSKINLVLPKKIGKVAKVYDVDPTLIEQVLLTKMDS